jgi:deazaflavin-dependent oxidoreductase (nitroreductase family)
MMAGSDFASALDGVKEISLTTTGRRSGRESSRPVWFVRQGGTLYLVPVTGTASQWYQNILATPAIRLAAAGTQYATDAVPVREAGNVAQILDAFRAKYGARDVASYYPNPNAAVEITL